MEGSGIAATRLKFRPARKQRNRTDSGTFSVIPAKAGIQTRCLACWQTSKLIVATPHCYRHRVATRPTSPPIVILIDFQIPSPIKAFRPFWSEKAHEMVGVLDDNLLSVLAVAQFSD
jgi:hypothetical protein